MLHAQTSNKKLTNSVSRQLRKRLLHLTVLGTLGVTTTAFADTFEMENGVQGRWALDISIGDSWRTRSADMNLVGMQNGGNATSSTNDDGTLNYKKGQSFSTLAKAIAEFEIKRDGFGFFARAKGWYDYTEKKKNVPFGNAVNGYATNQPLSDSGIDSLSQFSGLQLLDAYVYGSFAPAEGKNLSVKLGNHVVNWGESLFIGGGVNQYNPFDVAAARRPGAQLKEIILPTPQISANLGLGNGLSIEAFYLFKSQKTVLEGCGTYWGLSDVLNCSTQGGVVNLSNAFGATANDPTAFHGVPALGGANFLMRNAGDQNPKNSGQYGLSMHLVAHDIDYGAYFVNYNARTPIVSGTRTASPLPSAFNGIAGSYFWDWSAKDIKIYGLSASTEVGGWSVFGELSHTTGVPVQINGSDFLTYSLFGAGILSLTKGPLPGTPGSNTVIRGYDLKDKTQIQASTLKMFSNVMGAETLTILGEVGFQHWSGIGDPNSTTRYGRDFLYGTASSSAGACGAAPDYCSADGFATTNAWGYRAMASFSYPGAIAGVNLSPRIFWSDDVKGYSADATFNQGKRNLGLGVRADYLKKYYADFSYSTFNHSAKYDAQRDRDFASVVVGMTF